MHRYHVIRSCGVVQKQEVKRQRLKRLFFALTVSVVLSFLSLSGADKGLLWFRWPVLGYSSLLCIPDFPLFWNCAVDPNKDRREAVKRKTTQYLKRAEEIFITHLQDNLVKGSSHLGVRAISSY